jgi:hypothetical protein
MPDDVFLTTSALATPDTISSITANRECWKYFTDFPYISTAHALTSR